LFAGLAAPAAVPDFNGVWLIVRFPAFMQDMQKSSPRAQGPRDATHDQAVRNPHCHHTADH
jgi:hypothetical protein